MVADTGKALRADTLKPLNLPEPVNVEEDARGLPVALKTKRRQIITAIEDRWRIDDEWWRQEIARRYFDVELNNGSVTTVFQDLITGKWYRQRY